MALPNDEQVKLEIIIEAKKALAVLKQLRQEGEKLSETTKRAETALNQMTTKTESGLKRSTQAGQGFNKVLNLIRGTLVAIGVFRVFQFIEDSLRKAIGTATEYEQSLYRLVNVERILSEAGQEITLKGLQQGIKETKDLLPIFSEADITQEVASVALLTKELGFNEQQITDLSRAIGILNIRSTENEDLITTTNKVITALITGQARGVAALGLSFSETAVKTKAVELGLLKAGESLSKLTDQEKALAKLQIILETTGNELENIDDYLNTNVASTQKLSAAWEDFLKAAGQAILALSPILDVITNVIDVSTRNLKLLEIVLINIVAAAGAFGVALSEAFKGNVQSADEIYNTFEKIKNSLVERLFPERAIENIDTATQAVEELGMTIEELPDLDKLINDLEKLADKAQQAEEKFQTGVARDLEDFNIRQARAYEDLLRDISQVQQDANQKLADSNKRYRNNELDAEAKFQEQLRQLREKYLFNLEDALRERDARQVLRLQRQYQMDKQALINENALRKESAARNHQEDLARIRRERDDRIAELQQEYEIKQQREQEDFDLDQERKAADHQRDMDRIAQEIDDRLMEYARAIGEEYGLNEQGVNDLYNLLQQYYGPGGNFEKLYDYSYDALVSRAEQMLSEVNRIVAQAQASAASVSTLPTFNPGAISAAPFTGANLGNQAQGGTYLATRPTHAVFGDAGPEIASFIPVNKLRAGVGRGSAQGAGVGGTIELEMLLSPDLEARVVRNSMQGVSDVITRVRRTKQ